MATDIMGAYRNVCRELQGLEAYRDIAHKRLKAAHQVVFKGKMPSSLMCYVPLDKSLEYYDQAAKDYNETIDTIDQLNIVKMQMESLILEMPDLDKVIAVLHEEQGISLREIAEKTNYSYGHIRNTRSVMRKRTRELALAQ